MACDLSDRGGLTHYGARSYVGFAIVVLWTRPLSEGIDPSRRAFQMAKDHSDPTYAALASRGLITIPLALGHSLDQVEREAEDALEFVQRYGFFLDRLSAPIALPRTLRGKTAKFGSLDYGEFTERSFEERITGQRSRAFPRMLPLNPKAPGALLCRRLRVRVRGSGKGGGMVRKFSGAVSSPWRRQSTISMQACAAQVKS